MGHGQGALEYLGTGMRIIITGNLGYIGTVLSGMALAAGHKVMGIDSDLYRRCTFGSAGIPRVPTLFKDVRDLELADVADCDAILHLAGLSNDPLGDLDPQLTFEINYKASVRLAEMARQAGVQRFIFSSSCSNYGAGGDGMLTEESEFHPVTPYGESKVMVEREVSKMADDHFSPVFLRNATAYGYSPRIRFDLVLNNLVAWAFITGKVHLKSDGSAWRPIVHIEDISQAFLAAVTAPREAIHNQAFNVAQTAENYRIRELAEIVGKTVPDCRVEFAAGASADKRCYRVNCDKIMRTLTDYRPNWTAPKGAQQLLEEYRKNPFTLEEFEGPRYQRVAHIRMLLKEGVLDSTLRFKPIFTADVPRPQPYQPAAGGA